MNEFHLGKYLSNTSALPVLIKHGVVPARYWGVYDWFTTFRHCAASLCGLDPHIRLLHLQGFLVKYLASLHNWIFWLTCRTVVLDAAWCWKNASFKRIVRRHKLCKKNYMNRFGDNFLRNIPKGWLLKEVVSSRKLLLCKLGPKCYSSLILREESQRFKCPIHNPHWSFVFLSAILTHFLRTSKHETKQWDCT
jgi:hypothetical protein